MEAYIKEIMDLPVIQDVNVKKIHDFSDRLMYAIQALQTLNKLETVKWKRIHDP